MRDHACAAAQEQIGLEEDLEADGVAVSVAAVAAVGERTLFLALHAWVDHAGAEVAELVDQGRAEDDRVGGGRMSSEAHTVRVAAAAVVVASAAGQDHVPDPADVDQDPEEVVVLAYLY